MNAINKSLILFTVMIFPADFLIASEFSDLSLKAGYRQDSLDWNINGAGNPVGSSPNILSELTWRDLNIFQLSGEVTAANPRGIYFRGSAGYGWVRDGENQDSDYAGDNRTLEFSRSINDVNGSSVMDIKGGLGFVLPFGEKKQHHLAPLLGYSYHTQKLRMTNGHQVVSNSAYYDLFYPYPDRDVIAPGPFPGLDSSYDATWLGPWLGADILLDFETRGTVYLHLERHWSRYNAQANWNLINEFAHPVSFEHSANGRGWVLELGWRNLPSRHRWEWGLSMALQRWDTGSGTDRTYLVIPGPPCNGNCYTEGILNEVNWSSSTINFTLNKAIDP